MEQSELLAIFAALMVVLAVMGIAVDWIGKPLRNRKFIPRIYRYADENMVEVDPGRTAFSEAPMMLPSAVPQGVPMIEATGLSDWEQSHFVLPDPESPTQTWGALATGTTQENVGFAELLGVNTYDTFEQSMLLGDTVPMPPPLSEAQLSETTLPDPPPDVAVEDLPPPPVDAHLDTAPADAADADGWWGDLTALDDDETRVNDFDATLLPPPPADLEDLDDLLPPPDSEEFDAALLPPPPPPPPPSLPDTEAPSTDETAPSADETFAVANEAPITAEAEIGIDEDLLPAGASALDDEPLAVDDDELFEPEAAFEELEPEPELVHGASETDTEATRQSVFAELVEETPDEVVRASTFAGLVDNAAPHPQDFHPLLTAEQVTSEPGVWQPGDPLWSPTGKGTKPSPTLVRRRFWQSAAVLIPGVRWYGHENVNRMADGNPPRRRNRRTGKLESMQLTGLRSSDDRTISRPYWPGNEPDPFELY